MDGLTVLGLCGIIVSVGGAITYILKAFQPYNKLKERVKQNSDELKEDNHRLSELEKGNRIIQRSMIALLDHEITGNSIEKLTKARNELQNYLIER